MTCSLCGKRRAARSDGLCRTCRRFLEEYLLPGKIRPRRVPAVADVWLVMNRLGVSQDRAVRLLGGVP